MDCSNTQKPIVILGAGGHAKVLSNILKLSGREVLGFTTPDLKIGTEYCGERVLGDDSIIYNYSPNEIELVNGIGALPRKIMRWQLSSIMRRKGYYFISVIHPSANIASGVNLNEGVQVMAGAVIQSGVDIGMDSIINTGVVVDHDCLIGMNCHIATGVVCSGGVNIGASTHLGVGSIVTESIIIGKNCIIAAGSIVYRNVMDNTLFIQKKQLVLKNIDGDGFEELD